MTSVGCGDEASAPPAPSGDAEEIAGVINDVERAMAEGRSDRVCQALDSQGHLTMVRVALNSRPSRQATCERGVETLIARRLASTTGPYSAADIDLEPTPEGGDATTFSEDGSPTGLVTVDCKSQNGAAWFLRMESGKWKLDLPVCSGR